MDGIRRYQELWKLAAITLVVYLAFRFLLPLFFPFLFAYFLAWLIHRPVRFLARHLRICPTAGSFVLLALLLVGLCSAAVCGVTALTGQITLLAERNPGYLEQLGGVIEQACGYCDGVFGLHKGSIYRMLDNGMSHVTGAIREEWLPALTRKSVQAAVAATERAAALVIVLVAAILFSSEMLRQGENKEQKSGIIWMAEWQKIRRRLSDAGIAYLKTQLLLITLVSSVCCIGLALLQHPYALLLGLGIGIFDAFPVLGSGLLLVPWAAVSFFQKAYLKGAVLLSIYGICQFLREYLEPKLLGGKIGMRPVQSLMAIYIGYELFGIFGLFLGPIGVVLIRAVYESI